MEMTQLIKELKAGKFVDAVVNNYHTLTKEELKDLYMELAFATLTFAEKHESSIVGEMVKNLEEKYND